MKKLSIIFISLFIISCNVLWAQNCTCDKDYLSNAKNIFCFFLDEQLDTAYTKMLTNKYRNKHRKKYPLITSILDAHIALMKGKEASKFISRIDSTIKSYKEADTKKDIDGPERPEYDFIKERIPCAAKVVKNLKYTFNAHKGYEPVKKENEGLILENKGLKAKNKSLKDSLAYRKAEQESLVSELDSLAQAFEQLRDSCNNFKLARRGYPNGASPDNGDLAQIYDMATQRRYLAELDSLIKVFEGMNLIYRDTCISNLDSIAVIVEQLEQLLRQKPVPVLATRKIIWQDSIFFANRSFELEEKYFEGLDELAGYIKQNCTDCMLYIRGFASDPGDEVYDYFLAISRAKAVKKYLLEKGIPDHMIATDGYGEIGSGTNAPLDRRAEFDLVRSPYTPYSSPARIQPQSSPSSID